MVKNKQLYSGEGIVELYATRNPLFLLNNICLNQATAFVSMIEEISS